MTEPQFYKHPETGEVFELKPVQVDRQVLQTDLDESLKEAEELNDSVSKLESERDTLMEKVGTLNEALEIAYENQEAADEKVAFRQGRLNGFDAAPTADMVAPDAAPSNAAEDVDDDEDPDEDGDEELAEGDDLNSGADEPNNPSEDVEVPVRRRATV